MAQQHRIPSLLPDITVALFTGYWAATFNPQSESGEYFWLFLVCVTGLKAARVLWNSVRVIHNMMLRKQAYKTTTQHGSAAWAGANMLKRLGMHRARGIFLGALAENGKPLFHDLVSHALLVSPSGGKKTVSYMIPTAMHHNGSMIIADLKGTIACITAFIRKKIHKHTIYILNPAGLFKKILGESARYNPLILVIDPWLSGQHADVITMARNIALQLLPDSKASGNSDNAYFRKGSRKLLVFCIVYLVTHDTKNANFSTVLKLLEDDALMEDALEIAFCSDALSGSLARMAKSLRRILHQQGQNNHWGSFTEGAEQVLSIYSADGWLAENTSTCDFRFADLKHEKATIYMISDPARMDVFAPHLSLLGWCVVQEMMLGETGNHVLFLLDEASNFRIHGLISRLTEIREYKLSVFFAIQSLEAMEQTYSKQDVEILLDNCECKIFTSLASYKVSELVSKTIGQETLLNIAHQPGHSRHDAVTQTTSQSGSPLARPEDLLRYDEAIILLRSQPPILAHKVGYNEVSPWRDQAGINPYYGKKYKGRIRMRLKY